MPKLPFMVASVGSRGALHKPIDRHSSEWTHVVSRRRNQNVSEEALSDLFHRSARRVEAPAVAPKKDDLHSLFSHESSQSCRQKFVKKVSFQDKKFKPKTKNSFHVDLVSIGSLKMKIAKNDAILKKEMMQVSSRLASIKHSMKQSSEVAEIQKKLYSKLTKCIVDRLPHHWNQQWLRDTNLLSPSTLPRKSQDIKIADTRQAVNSMQDDIERMRQNIIHVSEDLHQWGQDMKQLKQTTTDLLSFDYDNDVAGCYSSDDQFNVKDTMNNWEPFFNVTKPPSSSFKLRECASGVD